jgi:hypothetical protein
LSNLVQFSYYYKVFKQRRVSMKYRLLIVSCFIAVSSIAVAANTKTIQKNSANVMVYAKPSPKSKTMMKISGDQKMAVIYRGKKGWLKVANTKTGQVGWVQKKQMRKAARARMQAKYNRNRRINSYFVEVQEQPGKPGSFVAYRNGKKLSPKASKKLYTKMQRQQMMQQDRFNRQMMQVQKQMDQMTRMMNAEFQQAFARPPIVVVQPQQVPAPIAAPAPAPAMQQKVEKPMPPALVAQKHSLLSPTAGKVQQKLN